ncbi:hypothetical protein [Phycicoccus jejuensis]|uniref:hypothetical protein n=1 Tax=Phycicoccus jejuensis TaxID=367299 RepID=UPI00068EFB0E|nr:hypothetical protein [Phycicoccus jejuensis]
MAHAAPASSSPDVLDGPARTELERIRRRWAQLPLATAQEQSSALRALAEHLAGLTAPGVPLPDLGPAALPDQLAVLAWDAVAAGGPEAAADVTERLVALRRALP